MLKDTSGLTYYYTFADLPKFPLFREGAVIQCKDCEFFSRGPGGAPRLACDPYSTIKEPECLLKWQLIELQMMSRSHQATLDMYRKFAPLQEKMFRHMEREIDEAEEGERWKYDESEDDEDSDD